MSGDELAPLVAAARRYRVAVHRFQAAVATYHARRTEATGRRVDEALAELDVAQGSLFAAALASDDAAVLLPGMEDHPTGADHR